MMWNGPLVELKLDCNPLIDDHAVKALCSGLRTKQNLKVLSLSYCGFTVGGAESLGKLLLVPNALEKLSVKGNWIGPQGLTALSQGLKSAWSLTSLDLGSSGIGSPVAIGSTAKAEKARVDTLDAWTEFTSALNTNLTRDRSCVEALMATGESLPHMKCRCAMCHAHMPFPGSTQLPSPMKNRTAPPKHIYIPPLPPLAEMPSRPLADISFLENNLMPEQAEVLLAILGAPTCPLKTLKVDITLPPELFGKLWRTESGGGGKKKKGKKGKKK